MQKELGVKKLNSKDKSTKEICFSYSSHGGVEFKEEEGEFYSSGFVATTHPDRAHSEDGEYTGDILTKNAITKIVEQIKSRQGLMADLASAGHDWIKEDNPSLAPVGRAIEAEVREMPGGHYGAYIKTHHDKTYPNFEAAKYKVEHGYWPGYSIEHIPTNTNDTLLGNEKFRIIDNLDLKGFGFARARMIANPEALIDDYGYKEIMSFVQNKKTEVKTMPDEKDKTPEGEDKKPEGETEKPAEETKPVEEPKPAAEEEKPTEEKVDEKEMKEFLQFKAMKAVTAKKEEAKTMFKELIQDKEFTKDLGIEVKPRLNNDIETKELTGSIEYKEFEEACDSTKKISFKERLDRASAYASKTGVLQRWANRQSMNYDAARPGRVQVKCTGIDSSDIQVKALETDTNKMSDTDYYQSGAELSDIYSPIVHSFLNQRTTWYGIIPKEDYSGYAHIQWRAEHTANTSAGAYFEGAAVTKGNTGRNKLQENFKYYSVGVQVTGQMIASARSGVGDIFSKEIEASARALLTVMNTALFAEKGAFTDEEFLGLEYIADSTGNATMYGLARGTYTWLGASGSEYAAQAGAALKKSTLRTAIETLIVNGASESDLIFVCHPRQKSMILKLIDDGQRYTTSARIGFEGMPMFDGVPIYSDKDANNNDIYLVNIGTFGMRLAVQVPVTYEDLAKSDDSRSGFLKFYGNQYAIAPKKALYMIEAVATS